VQLFHAHLTVAPTATVLVPGENALFVTVIPPDGVVVFPGGGLFGAVELDPPEPPQPQTAATVSATKSPFIVITPPVTAFPRELCENTGRDKDI
jgi:hypothetical protein